MSLWHFCVQRQFDLSDGSNCLRQTHLYKFISPWHEIINRLLLWHHFTLFCSFTELNTDVLMKPFNHGAHNNSLCEIIHTLTLKQILTRMETGPCSTHTHTHTWSWMTWKLVTSKSVKVIKAQFESDSHRALHSGNRKLRSDHSWMQQRSRRPHSHLQSCELIFWSPTWNESVQSHFTSVKPKHSCNISISIMMKLLQHKTSPVKAKWVSAETHQSCRTAAKDSGKLSFINM